VCRCERACILLSPRCACPWQFAKLHPHAVNTRHVFPRRSCFNETQPGDERGRKVTREAENEGRHGISTKSKSRSRSERRGQRITTDSFRRGEKVREASPQKPSIAKDHSLSSMSGLKQGEALSKLFLHGACFLRNLRVGRVCERLRENAKCSLSAPGVVLVQL
jgi:hypothetical protein